MNSAKVLGQKCLISGTEAAYDDLMEIYETPDGPAGPFYVRVQPHIIRQSNGSGGISEEDVQAALSFLSFAFAPVNIFFIPSCEINYIDEDTIYGQAVKPECDLWGYNLTNSMNIYFDSFDADSVGGLVMATGSNAFVVGGTYNFSNEDFENTAVALTHSISHEMGHCLGLYHTHHGNIIEYYITCEGDTITPPQTEALPSDTTAPVCVFTGDFLCDTPPDNGISWVLMNDECEYDNPLTDYTPDPRNIMSYAVPLCIDHFSHDQGALMRTMLDELPVLKACVIDGQRNVIISSDSSWTIENLPEEGDFFVADTLIVVSGYSFTIDSGVVVRFAESAVVIIEPDAELHLYGTLTSVTPCTVWQGVEVYGDHSESQYPDFGTYYHGLLKSYPGSRIENAITGVKTYGPEYSDGGGRITCIGTTFKNNRTGLYFAPYQNYAGSQPHPYLSSFTDCTFIVDDSLSFPVFEQMVALDSVDGIQFTGCDFINARTPSDEEHQYEFGYGIVAINSGFIVSAKFASTGDLCVHPCTTYTPSRFQGLGYGIYTGSFGANRLFRVYQSEFEDCYAGIEVDGVSAGIILFNDFLMGSVPDDGVMEGDQLGIKLSHQIAGFTIEENAFTVSSGNANHTIGIAVENLGEFNNVIRKNTFSGLTIANEAFGLNATTGDELNGLRYTCNINTGTSDKDFVVVDSLYGDDNISALQVDFDSDGDEIATGNQFSSSGDEEDGDFANYGSEIDLYVFYPSDPDQIPDDISGITLADEGQQNPCSQEYCAPPCLSAIDLSNLRDEYFDDLADYEYFLSEDQWLKTAPLKFSMDKASLSFVQHYLIDSSSFHRDSLRAWYSRGLTISGDLLLARDFASQGNYAIAKATLAGISLRFNLPVQVEDDIANIDTIFGMLDTRGLAGLTQGDIDDLIDLSDTTGQAASMARSILMLKGVRFETRYVLPEEEHEPFAIKPTGTPPVYNELTIFPNPVIDKQVNITIPDIWKNEHLKIELFDFLGVQRATYIITAGTSQLEIPDDCSLLSYRVVSGEEIIKSGWIVRLRN